MLAAKGQRSPYVPAGSVTASQIQLFTSLQRWMFASVSGHWGISGDTMTHGDAEVAETLKLVITNQFTTTTTILFMFTQALSHHATQATVYLGVLRPPRWC